MVSLHTSLIVGRYFKRVNCKCLNCERINLDMIGIIVNVSNCYDFISSFIILL